MTRPRDRLGRPLPPGAEGYPAVPERTDIRADEAVAQARRYLADGLPFHAHEVLEQRWRCCPPRERAAWRALAQAAASSTHAARGNAVGAERLLARARETLLDGASPDTAAWAEQIPGLDALLAELALPSIG